MKVLFLHLSDLHFENKDNIIEKYIDEIGAALSPKSIGSVDKIFVFVTGDIAYSGKNEQYGYFQSFKRILVNSLKEHVLSGELFHIYIVPGNHDIDYDISTHTRDECETLLKTPTSIDLSAETQSQTAFLRCSKTNHSLTYANPLFKRTIVDLNGFLMEINLLNSTLFSLKHNNDQGLHYLPAETIQELSSSSGANMAITLMHHSHQWFNDSCKATLEKIILEKSTMVFCGHEHFQATQAISYNGHSPTHFFCGGSLCNCGNWAKSEFFACIFDTDNNKFQHLGFILDTKKPMYIKRPISQGVIEPKVSHDFPKVTNNLAVQKIMNDTNIHLSDKISDYYVFPGVTREGSHKNINTLDIFSLDSFYKEFEDCKHIELSGHDSFGKSALLKMVFKRYLTSKCVLFCKIEDISSGNRRRIIKSLFEDIYGESEVAYQQFERLDKEHKMILIDDIHLINPKHVTSFLGGIEEEFGYVLYTTSNTIKLDMEERIKAAISKDSYACFKLNPLYKSQREELVERVLALKNPRATTDELAPVASRITYALDLQRRYVPLTPEIIIKFIDYFSTFQMESGQNDGSLFGKVFESSITTALAPHVRSPLTVDKVFMILGKVAYYIHDKKKYPITDQEILDVISDYCEEYGGSIDGVELINSVLQARLMSKCGDEGAYKFCNNNYLAYFVAFEICNSKNSDAVLKCLHTACFGICASILLFVTYITNEQSIIDLILSSAISTIEGWKEFSFSMKDISHLNSVSPSIELLPPSEEEKKSDQAKDFEKDREEVDNSTLDIINIYDYDDADIEKLENQLTRSISLLMLLARCLPNFEHRLKKPQKEGIVRALYTIPNQIFYVWATHVEQCKDELLQLITTMETNSFVRRQPTFEDAQQILQWNSLSLLLELYHGVANNSYRENTIEFLSDWGKSLVSFDEETHLLEYLIILCKANKVTEFISTATAMKESCKLPAANLSLVRVVHHLLIKGNANPKQIDQIESKFFPKSKRSSTIYHRRIEDTKN